MSIFKKDPYFEPVTPKWKDAKIFLLSIPILMFVWALYQVITAQPQNQLAIDEASMVIVQPGDINRSGLSKPVMQIVSLDGSCTGVIRADKSYDGDCTEVTSNLPPIAYDKFFDLQRMPLD